MCCHVTSGLPRLVYTALMCCPCLRQGVRPAEGHVHTAQGSGVRSVNHVAAANLCGIRNGKKYVAHDVAHTDLWPVTQHKPHRGYPTVSLKTVYMPQATFIHPLCRN